MKNNIVLISASITRKRSNIATAVKSKLIKELFVVIFVDCFLSLLVFSSCHRWVTFFRLTNGQQVVTTKHNLFGGTDCCLLIISSAYNVFIRCDRSSTI